VVVNQVGHGYQYGAGCVSYEQWLYSFYHPKFDLLELDTLGNYFSVIYYQLSQNLFIFILFWKQQKGSEEDTWRSDKSELDCLFDCFFFGQAER
jgi:hypothetical protein